MKIRLSIKTLTVGDIIKAEAGFTTTAATVDFLARFAVDENGDKLPHPQAVDAICELPLSDLPGLAEQLAEQIRAWKEAAVPLVTVAS